MKAYASIAAIAVAAFLFPASAFAECGPGQYEVITNPGDPEADPPVPPTSACFNRFNLGHGVATTGGIDPEGPHKQGGPSSGTEVHGLNGVAVGQDARVGAWVPPVPGACSDGGYTNESSCLEAQETWTPPVPGYAVPVDNGTAIGANSSVQHNNSTALGAGAVSTDDHQVTLGTGDETIRAPGITSQLSKDRQTDGAIELVTSDQGGHLATDGGRIYGTLNEHSALLQSYGDKLNEHSALLQSYGDKLKEHAKGLAIAAAMPDAWLSDNSRFGMFGSVGGFDGETAVGFAAIGRLSRSFTINAKIGFDTSAEHIGYSVGGGWMF